MIVNQNMKINNNQLHNGVSGIMRVKMMQSLSRQALILVLMLWMNWL